MTTRVQVFIGVVVVAAIGLLLWPIFSAGEPGLLLVLIGFLGAGALLAWAALRTKGRWPRYALMGIAPGFILGGIALFSFVRLTSSGADGWEGLVAVAAGIMGAFGGAVLGAIVGGLFGLARDRQSQDRSRR